MIWCRFRRTKIFLRMLTYAKPLIPRHPVTPIPEKFTLKLNSSYGTSKEVNVIVLKWIGFVSQCRNASNICRWNGKHCRPRSDFPKEQSYRGLRCLFRSFCPNAKNFTNFTANMSESELLSLKSILKNH